MWLKPFSCSISMLYSEKRGEIVVGTNISHYHIVEKLGESNMGVVYRALDTELNRTVALKFLSLDLTRDPETKKRFLNENRITSTLDHPAICAVHEISETADGQLFIAMAWCQGISLQHKIKQGPVPFPKAIAIAVQIAEGLAYAHSKGIFHGDIQPASIMLVDGRTVKIMDFGLEKFAEQINRTHGGPKTGISAYMSPEQVRGNGVDQRSDLWALGTVLYEMLTGRHPFKGENEQAVTNLILNENPQPVTNLQPGIKNDVNQVISKALARDVNLRYQHAGEMLSDFNDLLTKPEPVAVESPPHIEKKKSKLVWPALLLFILIVGLFSFWPFRFQKELVLASKPIAVVYIENLTGDAGYDYLKTTIPNLLITDLEQSPYLQVTTWERLRDLLKQTGKAETDTIDMATGFKLCRMDGIKAMVMGSFIKAGDIFATDVRVYDVETKTRLISVSATGKGVASILESQIDQLSIEISQGIGLSRGQSMKEQARTINVTTPSMNAYNYFLRGRENLGKSNWDQARYSFERAVRLDTTFAVAYLGLAEVYGALQDFKKRNECCKRAMAFSDRATEKDRLFIEAEYAAAVEKNPEKSSNLLKKITQDYPKEKRAYYRLGEAYISKNQSNNAVDALTRALGLDPAFGAAIDELAHVYARLGNYDKALECFTRYASINPGNAMPIDSMGDLYWRMGQFDKAMEKYIKVLEIKPGSFQSGSKAGYICAMSENYETALRYIEREIASSPSVDQKGILYFFKGFMDYWLGRTEMALNDLNQAKQIGNSFDNKYLSAASDWLKAYIYYDRGETESGEKCFQIWLDYCEQSDRSNSITHQAENDYYMGLVNLKLGRIDSTRLHLARMQESKSQIPAQWFNRRIFEYDLLSGETALAQGTPEKAISVFKKQDLQDVPDLGFPQIVIYNLPFQKDGLARAYRQAGKLTKAISEYERLILPQTGRQERYLIHPLYHHRLAWLYEQKGAPIKAIEQYQKFLLLWKDADKSWSEVRDAEARLNALKKTR
jgi:eukaryotic-like serine/threonine-protein kinase